MSFGGLWRRPEARGRSSGPVRCIDLPVWLLLFVVVPLTAAEGVHKANTPKGKTLNFNAAF